MKGFIFFDETGKVVTLGKKKTKSIVISVMQKQKHNETSTKKNRNACEIHIILQYRFARYLNLAKRE